MKKLLNKKNQVESLSTTNREDCSIICSWNACQGGADSMRDDGRGEYMGIYGINLN